MVKIMSDENKHIGSKLDSFLLEEGLLESSQSFAIKRVLAWQISQYIQQEKLTKAAMAMRMNTSRSALDRLLDPDNDSVTLKTLQNAASAIGAHLEMKLIFNTKAA
jgi:predicted XRE-type DNA-binding protein